MITEEDIAQAREQEKLLAETYLKGIVDFVKWSSTVAIAAILWIGNNITSVARQSWVFPTLSLTLLISSLVVAIFTVKRVLTAWAREWDVAREDYSFSLFKKWKAFKASGLKPTETDEIDTQERERIDHLIKAIDAAKPFSESKGFSAWVGWHIILLIAGLFVYALAQILSTL